MYNDLPPAIDPDSLMDDRFIPPPPGAVQGGQPIGYNSFPGANPAASQVVWPPPQTSWSAGAAQVPAWLAQQQMQSPPSSSQSWAYGQQYPSHTPYAQTPAGSYGDGTPAPSWGPATPVSANNPYPGYPSPYVQQSQQGYVSNPAQESSTGQPITASPWFNGGGGTLGGGGTPSGYPAFGGGYGAGDTLSRRKSKSRRSIQHQQEPYPSYPSTPFSNPDLGLNRTNSHEVPGFGMDSVMGYPLQRSHSFSAYQQKLQSQGEEYSARNPARRPRDWRPDFDSREGLASYIPKLMKHRSDVTEWTDPVRRTAHSHLAYKPQYPPVYYDVRYHPFFPSPIYNNATPLEFPILSRPPNALDFAQLATSPPASGMRLFHPLLPWYIDVAQTHPNGVTVQDVILQMFVQLDVPIQGRHWFNDDVDEAMRSRITEAYQLRLRGNPHDIKSGVKRVDFLKGKVVFEGLTRGRNGLWEIKTRRLDG